MISTGRLAALLGLLAAFGPLSIDMYLPAFPDIGASLGGSVEGVQLTLAAYFVGMAGGQLLHGPLSDRLGRRRPLFAGLIVYVVVSALCALATSMEALVALRLLQALAGCAGMVISRAVVRDVSDVLDPVRLMGRLMLVMGVAPILAPLMGGYISAWFGWRAIFWFLALVGLGTLILCTFFLPETLPDARRRRVSFLEILRSYASLLVNRRFMGAALASGFAIAGMFAYIAGSPFVFITLNGVAAEHYGWLFGGAAAGFIVFSQLSARLAARLGRERLFNLTIAIIAASGIGLVALTALGAPFLAQYAMIFLYVSLLGIALPLGTIITITPFPHMAGTASALVGTLQFGMGAVAGTIISVLHDGTALPMALTIGLAGSAALVARVLLRE
ncbi:Bcr/CflA family multidrug efflux MFS transporter [Sediminicoccus sp. KRV36]|uniref:Bcr/CflA family multidrug efflux MFS transporter n=1 Tax=Sediminicoccus sp. KRV36 TaxID=3133721 RepID=UPI0020103112|nr:Bcr/CflA family multidrug efflux MFS transporter [Sediminicoccus rosea]UPY35457.1 Bcr/CflA family multidrug efflux MFS transporter [Sediminicoccus rosea]